MIQKISIFLFLISFTYSFAQEIHPDILHIQKRMDSINAYTADLKLDLNVPFIQMPTKHAAVSYKQESGVVFSSEDFVMLPKRGIDFSLTEIFKYAYITLDRGMQPKENQLLRVINILPTDEKSGLALVTVYLDSKNKRIVFSDINTKNDGSYSLYMQYASAEAILPNKVNVSFAVERLKVPLQFMGKDTKVDRKQMRNLDVKTGEIAIEISNYKISRK